MPGSACDRRAEKRSEPAIFGVLGARLGRFFGAGAEKVAWGGLLGARLEMLLGTGSFHFPQKRQIFLPISTSYLIVIGHATLLRSENTQ